MYKRRGSEVFIKGDLSCDMVHDVVLAKHHDWLNCCSKYCRNNRFFGVTQGAFQRQTSNGKAMCYNLRVA